MPLASPVHPRAVEESPGALVDEEPPTELLEDRQPVDPTLLAVVNDHPRLAGWTLVPLLELRTPSRALVVVWPAFNPQGELTVSDVPLGVVLAIEGGGAVVVEEPFDASELTPDLAAAHVGARAFTVRDRGAGLDLVAFGERLAVLPQLFAEAVEEGDQASAVENAIAYGRLYGPWAVHANVGRGLLLATRGELRIEHLGTDPPAGDRARIRLSLAVPGEPAAEVELEARRLPDRPRWVVSAPTP